MKQLQKGFYVQSDRTSRPALVGQQNDMLPYIYESYICHK